MHFARLSSAFIVLISNSFSVFQLGPSYFLLHHASTLPLPQLISDHAFQSLNLQKKFFLFIRVSRWSWENFKIPGCYLCCRLPPMLLLLSLLFLRFQWDKDRVILNRYTFFYSNSSSGRLRLSKVPRAPRVFSNNQHSLYDQLRFRVGHWCKLWQI